MRSQKGRFIGVTPAWTTTETSGIFSLGDVAELKASGQWPRGPVAPVALSASASASEVSLAWTAPATLHGSLTGYAVEYTPSGGSPVVVATGSTSASYTVTGLANGTEYTFRVAAINHTTGEWSGAATATPVAPEITITQQPTPQTAVNDAATFTVAATVTLSATLSYQWEKQEGGAGAFAAVSGATSDTLSLTSLTSADDNGDVYRCVVSATGGATPVTSSSAALTVPEPAGDAPLLLVLGGDNAPRDASPNNYWLTTYSYYSNGNTLAIENDGYNFWYLPYPSDAGPDGASSYAVGYDGYVGYALSLGLSRYANLSGVGESDFFSKISSGPFTLEGWWKPGDDIANSYGYAERYFQIGRYVVAAQPEDQYNTDTYGYPAGVDAFGIFLDSPGNSNFVGLSPNGAPAANQWHHIALVDDGTVASLYVDGTRVASGAALPWDSSNSYFDIGDSYGPWVSSFTGLRVTGSAIYTGNSITVPTPNTPRPTNPQTELLLNATHGLEDWGPRGQHLFLYNYYSGGWGFNSATGQGTTLNTTVKKFGAASYAMGVATAYRDNGMALQPVSFYTGGSNDPSMLTPGYLTGTLENGPFTVEMWVRPTGTINYSDIALGNDPSKGEAYISISYNYGVIALYDNTQSNRLYQDNTDVIPAGLSLEFYDEINGVSHRISTASLTRDEWHHLAVVADTANNALRLKVDGTDVGAIDITSLWGGEGSIYSNDYSTLAFGQLQHNDESYWWGLLQGYMDDLRVSNVALYGSSSYSVPTGALT
jgi:hypothetical protein